MQNVLESCSSGKPSRVSICVATFRRPRLLQSLLDVLAQLSFRKVCQPSLQIIVADNDAAQSAKSVCERIDFPWPLRYVCEPIRGIARARNRAIECAAQADFLAFIDDDEVPVARWLDELLWAQFHFQSDVVSGTVIPAFAGDVPAWARNGGFFRRPVFETGYPVRLASTNNSLIRREVLGAVPAFDERFNFTGGEDTHFFVRVREAGFRMVFCKEAVVYEPVSARRANLSWLLRRGFQAGNSWAVCEESLHAGIRTPALRVLKEFVHIACGAATLLSAPFAGKARLVRSLQKMSTGFGCLAGIAGYRFSPYRHVHETEAPSPTGRKEIYRQKVARDLR